MGVLWVGGDWNRVGGFRWECQKSILGMKTVIDPKFWMM